MDCQVIIFWSCIAFVVLVALGWTVFGKIRALNKKYHVVEIDDDSVYAYEVGDED